MNDIAISSDDRGLGEFDFAIKQYAQRLYKLIALGIPTLGITWLVCALWATYKVSDTKGSLFEDHFPAAILTSWLSLYATGMGLLLSVAGYDGWGFAYYGNGLIVVAWCWMAMRARYGYQRLTSNSGYRKLRGR